MTIFVREDELPRAFDALERAGVMIDRTNAVREVSRIGMFKGLAGRIIVDVFITGHPQYEAMKHRCSVIEDPDVGKLSFISPEDLCIHKLLYGRESDRRLAVLDDLKRRLTEQD
jgi:hypothetical protein